MWPGPATACPPGGDDGADRRAGLGAAGGRAYAPAMPHRVTAVANAHCATGEGPMYHPGDGRVYWTDIPTGRLFRCDPDADCERGTGDYETVYEGEPVGGFTLQENGDLILFRVRDVVALSPDGSIRPVADAPWDDPGIGRFNDVFADPTGRVYAGTIGKDKSANGLYRVDRDRSIRPLFAGTGCANGMGLTPDGRHLYYTDTTDGRIDRYAYDRDTGDLTDRQDFYRAADGDGHPDGMCVDENGFVWSAHYGGHGVFKIDPATGKAVDKIELPPKACTCPAWGGPGNDVMFVTTARGKPDAPVPGDPAGTLYRVDGLGVRGAERHRSRL